MTRTLLLMSLLVTACGGGVGPLVRSPKPYTNEKSNILVEEPDSKITITERHGYFEITEPVHDGPSPENFTLNITLLDLKPLTAAEGIANMQTSLGAGGWQVKSGPTDAELLGMKGKQLLLVMPDKKLASEVFVATIENDHCMVTYLATGPAAADGSSQYLEHNHTRIKLDTAGNPNPVLHARACTKDLPVQY